MTSRNGMPRCAALALVLAFATTCLVWTGHALADAFPDTISFDGFEACGLKCLRVQCGGNATTSISGTVFAPNATLPLPNVEVYVPDAAVEAFVDGPDAPRCDEPPSGHPVVATLTDANGHFVLANVPVTSDLPLVIVAGKWRRQITVPSVAACADTALAAYQTRLPRNHSEGDIAHLAVVTGSADTLECLIRKVGVDDTEFSTSAGSGRIHLFAGASGSATHQFSAALGGATFASASTLWASSATLSAYDQVMLACDGSQNPGGAISSLSLDALVSYANSGGRAYLAHLQNYWLQQSAAWSAIAGWANLPFPTSPLTAQVANDFAQAAIEYDWLAYTGASAPAGTLAIVGPRQTAISIDTDVARRWIYATANSQPSMQLFTFVTPIGASADSQLGRVLFTDMHAYVGDQANQPFPSGCASTTLSAQEKALAYASFDLQRCVGSTRE